MVALLAKSKVFARVPGRFRGGGRGGTGSSIAAEAPLSSSKCSLCKRPVFRAASAKHQRCRCPSGRRGRESQNNRGPVWSMLTPPKEGRETGEAPHTFLSHFQQGSRFYPLGRTRSYSKHGPRRAGMGQGSPDFRRACRLICPRLGRWGPLWSLRPPKHFGSSL